MAVSGSWIPLDSGTYFYTCIMSGMFLISIMVCISPKILPKGGLNKFEVDF